MKKPIADSLLKTLAKAIFGTGRGGGERRERMLYLNGLRDGVRFASIYYGFDEQTARAILKRTDENGGDFDGACDEVLHAK